MRLIRGVRGNMADPLEAKKYYGVDLCSWEDLKNLGAIILAVPHGAYREKSVDDRVSTLGQGGCLIDVKSKLILWMFAYVPSFKSIKCHDYY
ncbi:hypothetical protein [Desulfobacula sp.]